MDCGNVVDLSACMLPKERTGPQRILTRHSRPLRSIGSPFASLASNLIETVEHSAAAFLGRKIADR